MAGIAVLRGRVSICGKGIALRHTAAVGSPSSASHTLVCTGSIAAAIAGTLTVAVDADTVHSHTIDFAAVNAHPTRLDHSTACAVSGARTRAVALGACGCTAAAITGHADHAAINDGFVCVSWALRHAFLTQLGIAAAPTVASSGPCASRRVAVSGAAATSARAGIEVMRVATAAGAANTILQNIAALGEGRRVWRLHAIAGSCTQASLGTCKSNMESAKVSGYKTNGQCCFL